MLSFHARIILLVLCSLTSNKSYALWSHLEIGAGNYGGNATMNSLFIPVANYSLLYKTLDNLVKQKGDEGVFYVNDIDERFAENAAIALDKYAKKQKYKIEIRVLPGDATNIHFPTVDSVHIKNPSEVFTYVLKKNNAAALSRLQNYARSEILIVEEFGPALKKAAESAGLTLVSVPSEYRYKYPLGISIPYRKAVAFQINVNPDRKLPYNPIPQSYLVEEISQRRAQKPLTQRSREFMSRCLRAINPLQ